MPRLKTPFAILAMTVLSGLLLFLSFPKYGNGIAIWVALIPLFYALKDAGSWEAFRLGFLTGLVAHVGILYWIAYVVVQYGYLPITVGIAAMFLLAAYLSLYTACFAMGVVWLRKSKAPLLVCAPLLWTVLEYVRAKLFTGFPWENLAYSQYLSENIIQIADITGIYGITFLIVLINVVLYDLLMFQSPHRQQLWESIAALVIISAVYGYGQWRLATIGASFQKAPELEVALIQGNIDQNLKWNLAYQLETIDIYRSLSLTANTHRGGLIVWPETAAPFYFQRPERLQAAVIDIAKQTGASLLFGSPSYEERDDERVYRNSAFLLTPDGTLAGQYDKMYLVPYGEYVPLRNVFPFIGKLVAGVGDFMPGKGFHPLNSGDRNLGVLICYEGIFPEAARAYKQAGAEMLVNITNDAWFGATSAPYQHLSMTVFRAIENRLPLIRVANTGVSAIIDPLGKICSKTALFERSVLMGSIKIIDERTFYTAYGDLFVILCAVILFILCISNFQRRRRHVGRNS